MYFSKKWRFNTFFVDIRPIFCYYKYKGTKEVNTMLTAFGIALRKLRLDHGEILKTMADKLGISSSYLSAIETGTRNIPDDFISRLSNIYNLDGGKTQELEKAQLESQKEVTVRLDNAAFGKRDTALLFARRFSDLDEQTAEKIKRLINNAIKGE